MNPFPTAIAAVSDVIAMKRESMRGILALIVVGLLVIYSLAMLWTFNPNTGDDAQILLAGVFTPIIGIVGTVVGFYFGSQDKS